MRLELETPVSFQDEIVPNRLLKNPHAAPYGVTNRLKMLMYWRVHCAFSPLCALSCTRLKLFQQPVKGTQLAGWAALVHALGLQAPVRQPSCVSEKHIGGSQREEDGFRVFNKHYQPGDDVADQLTFALRHENNDTADLYRYLD